MFVQVINRCAGLGALAEGRIVCEQLIQSGCESDVFVGSSLLELYFCLTILGAPCELASWSTQH